MKNNVVKLDDYKSLEEVISQRVGEKFVISFMDEDKNVYTYTSPGLTHIEQVYMGENIKQIAFEQ